MRAQSSSNSAHRCDHGTAPHGVVATKAFDWRPPPPLPPRPAPAPPRLPISPENANKCGVPCATRRGRRPGPTGTGPDDARQGTSRLGAGRVIQACRVIYPRCAARSVSSPSSNGGRYTRRLIDAQPRLVLLLISCPPTPPSLRASRRQHARTARPRTETSMEAKRGAIPSARRRSSWRSAARCMCIRGSGSPRGTAARCTRAPMGRGV